MELHPLLGGYAVSTQLRVPDLARVKELGFVGIVNNRPDREVLPPWNGAAIAAAAAPLGLHYWAFPVGDDGGIGEAIEQLAAVISAVKGPLLGYCASGTRSAMLWALASARLGVAPQLLFEAAAREGYDLTPVLDAMEQFAARRVREVGGAG